MRIAIILDYKCEEFCLDFLPSLVDCLRSSGNTVQLILQKKDLISNNHHLILESVHPSPLSASKSFFKNNHFKKSNEFLHSKGLLEINWNLD